MAEQQGTWRRAGQRSRSRSGSKSLSWSAPDNSLPPLRGGWTCGGKSGCGFRRNTEAKCSVCKAPWGQWWAATAQDWRAPLANSFGPLADDGLARLQTAGSQGAVPPWKQSGKGRGVSWPPLLPVRNGSKGKGKTTPPSRGSAAPPSRGSGTNSDMEVEAVEQGGARQVDLDALRRLLATTVSTLGGDSQEAKGLQCRIQQEASKKWENKAKHILLNSLE